MAFSDSKKSIGLVLTANGKGGPQKTAAVAALGLAKAGHSVVIYVPVLPFYYYFMAFKRRPLAWLVAIRPYISDWIRYRRFSFDEILSGEARTRITVKFVTRRPSRRQMKRHDLIIIGSIETVVLCQSQFPQERQIYLMHHPEEIAHGHAEEFKSLRRSFRGKIIVISPFTARQISDHIVDPPIVPDPISPAMWNQRETFDASRPRRDLVMFWKDNSSAAEGISLIKSVLEIRPDTSVTIWCRGIASVKLALINLPDAEVAIDLTEIELRDLYLDHSLLLFPTRFEGFGMPPIEALACGCIPVMHRDVGAAEIYAKDGVNSVALSDSPDETAQRIANLLDDSEILEAMRREAPHAIVEFDPYTYGKRILHAAGIDAS